MHDECLVDGGPCPTTEGRPRLALAPRQSTRTERLFLIKWIEPDRCKTSIIRLLKRCGYEVLAHTVRFLDTKG
jgi:hypothetical protein